MRRYELNLLIQMEKNLCSCCNFICLKAYCQRVKLENTYNIPVEKARKGKVESRILRFAPAAGRARTPESHPLYAFPEPAFPNDDRNGFPRDESAATAATARPSAIHKPIQLKQK